MARLRMVTVATYNILHGLHLASAGHLDLGAAARTIATLDVDVVGVQEVDRGLARTGGVDQVAALARRLGWTGVFAPALLGDPECAWTVPGTRDPGGPAYGIGVLSRWPIIEWRSHRLPGGGDGRRQRPASPSRPGWDREPRAALVCRIHTGARPLTVVTTHLSYLPWRGIRQLRAAARLADGPDPAVLLGDLNLPPGTVRTAVPGWDVHTGPPTYPSWQPRMQIDHVLSREMTVRDVRAAERSTSDHLPLVAEFLTP